MMARKALEAALELLFPKRAVCMGCGSASGCREDWICPKCREALNLSWIGADSPPETLDGAAFAYRYLNPAASIVQKLKYSSIHRIAAFMAEDMVRAYRFIEPTGADCVAWVPMHPRRLRRRGYNHAELLARRVAERLEIECVNALECVRYTRQQARLTAEERRLNLLGNFRPRMSLEGRRVILVDDVCTTGSTARVCAAALREGGAAHVYLLCYCRAKKQE